MPAVDDTEGFSRALSRVSESIVSEQVKLAFRRAWSEGLDVGRAFQEIVLRVARKCWSRELDLMDTDTLLDAAEADENLTAEQRAGFRTILLRETKYQGK